MSENKRTCGSCTKCCEGWLSGEALGHSFYPGKPCHFISIGKGCSVYSKRPKDPCVSYKCAWLLNLDFPEWMKPDEVNAIIDFREINGIKYIQVNEAGETLRSDVLTWIIQYCIKEKLNLSWKIKNGNNFLGTQEFLEVIKNQ